ncbi:MAG: hypothetical protein ACUVRR_03755, partial [Candidatus Fervidibacter sp.]|uniref:hypothetical protein n=1 Tax=Candidatus Fervidibacter sp. TaxID=3100871 RepID=UPI00404B1426
MAGLVAILLWATLTPSPLVIITWHAPYRINFSSGICDLDGDGDEEVLVYNWRDARGIYSTSATVFGRKKNCLSGQGGNLKELYIQASYFSGITRKILFWCCGAIKFGT